ncbi:trypsin-like peptidase domain-containing protein [Granulicoccus phenolivorans]|uniref:trypsin-like peptidase domain-containing protein n=1 Tax=Granulicoccus phenolivorans TaxID=266854 RepID=UPI000423B26B|nr:trypsin-like peptidase domain-containing protein [Granulicoccus phenolivorans]
MTTQQPNSWNPNPAPHGPEQPNDPQHSGAAHPASHQSGTYPNAGGTYPNAPQQPGSYQAAPGTHPTSAFGTGYAGPQQPGPYAPAPAGSTQVATTRPRRSKRWLAIPAVALLAGVLGSGITLAATDALGSAPSNSSGGTVKVIQGNAANPDWSVTAAAAAPSVVSIQVSNGRSGAEGSGVILDTEGHIVTNNHVVSAAGQGAQLQVTMNDAQVRTATVVGTDPSTDLAVIKLDNPPANLSPIKFADVSQLKVGEPVMALGNPLGLSQTATTGIISALNRPVITQADSQQATSTAQQAVTDAIQTNAAINPGNSGGALLNANGELIGITSSIATLGGQESGNIGIGFAIPADQVTTVTQQLLQGKTPQHTWLGVSTRDATAQAGDSTTAGAQVVQVAGNSPAAQAGLTGGDTITAIDGKSVGSAEALMAQIRSYKVGQEVTLTIVRNGQQSQVKVTLAAATN